MEGPNLDDQLEQTAQDILKRLKELESSTSWKDNGTKPCQKYKMEVDGRVAAMGVHTAEYNIEKVIAFLEKEESLAKINPQVIEIKVLYEKKDVFKVNYQQYKGIWPVSNRDFVSVGIKIRESETKMYIGTKACNYPHPEVKGVVRGEIFIGGYIIEKIDENNTKIIYISDADLKGSIPGMVKNTLSEKQGEVASKIGYVMKKEGF